MPELIREHIEWLQIIVEALDSAHRHILKLASADLGWEYEELAQFSAPITEAFKLASSLIPPEKSSPPEGAGGRGVEEVG